MEEQHSDWYQIVWHDCLKLDDQNPWIQILRTAKTDPKPALFGEVRNFDIKGLGYRSIPLICDNSSIEQFGLSHVSTTWTREGPMIIFHDSLMHLPQEIIDVIIWHEVGHIHLEHPLKARTRGHAELIKERIDFVRRGEVVPDEIEADAFAVKMVGEGPVLRYLLFSYKARIKEVDIKDFGLREFKMRMQRIIEGDKICRRR